MEGQSWKKDRLKKKRKSLVRTYHNYDLHHPKTFWDFSFFFFSFLSQMDFLGRHMLQKRNMPHNA